MASSMRVTLPKSTFTGKAVTARSAKAAPAKAASLVVRADGGFIGSTNNIIMTASTATFLFAGRFGLAPATNKFATAGLKLKEVASGMSSNDPAGFTGVDVLAFGALGHIVGAGLILSGKF
mmetsp:Transcript_57942/g.183909  ORF Transcript_57942/g.183909 Transcript_57942/m.183909 type:complete len:121 (+) Transcript_57942:1225-1587(+)